MNWARLKGCRESKDSERNWRNQQEEECHTSPALQGSSQRTKDKGAE